MIPLTLGKLSCSLLDTHTLTLMSTVVITQVIGT